MSKKEKIKEVKISYQPHNYQKKFHEFCKLDNPAFFITVVAGRQSGKTFMMINQAVRYCLENKNFKVWIVSPSDAQSVKLFNEIKAAFQSTGLIRNSGKSTGNIYIKFISGSELVFKSALSEDRMRGASLDVLFIDEAAYVKEDTLNEILLPTLNVRGKKFIAVTTPKGKNWVYDYFIKGQSKTESKYESLRFTSEDNPKANKTIIQAMREQLPDRVFQQEFEAKFVDSGGCFQNVKGIAIGDRLSRPLASKSYFAGIDVGMKRDALAVSVFDDTGVMVDLLQFKVNDAGAIKVRLKDFLKKWNPKKTYLETNNQGLVFYHDLRGDIPGLTEFVTTSQSKEEIVSLMMSAFHKNEVILINDANLINEFENFVFTFSKSGKMLYQAATGHDDIVMSACIGYKCYLDNRNKQVNYSNVWV